MDGDLQVRKILRPLDYVGLSVPVQGRIPNRPIAKADCRPHFVRKYFFAMRASFRGHQTSFCRGRIAMAAAPDIDGANDETDLDQVQSQARYGE
jgi:hypothetical protein